jgi:hypothetical protein
MNNTALGTGSYLYTFICNSFLRLREAYVFIDSFTFMESGRFPIPIVSFLNPTLAGIQILLRFNQQLETVM